MNSSWFDVAFGEFVNFNPKIPLKKGKPYPYVPMEKIKPGYKYVASSINKTFNGSGKKFKNGDTLFARITPCLENGKIAQVESLEGLYGFGSTEFFIFRGIDRISDSNFIYYYTLTDWFRQNAVNSMVGASGRQRADAKFVSKSCFKFPPLQIQKKIANILSAYDDFIENNLKRIKLLEELAQITYEKWFVRMRFPGYESTAIDSDKGLPKGWQRKKLGEVTDLIKRGISPKYVDENGTIIVNQKCIRHNRVNFTLSRQTSSDKKIPAEKFVKSYDILVNSTGAGTLGRVAQCFDNVIATVDSHVTIVRASNKISSLYLGRVMESMESVLESLGKGATNQKELSAADMALIIDIVVPSKNLQKKYHNMLSLIYKEISNLISQNILLKEARDILLPRLMTGLIDVKQYDPAKWLEKEVII